MAVVRHERHTTQEKQKEKQEKHDGNAWSGVIRVLPVRRSHRAMCLLSGAEAHHLARRCSSGTGAGTLVDVVGGLVQAFPRETLPGVDGPLVGERVAQPARRCCPPGRSWRRGRTRTCRRIWPFSRSSTMQRARRMWGNLAMAPRARPDGPGCYPELVAMTPSFVG